MERYLTGLYVKFSLGISCGILAACSAIGVCRSSGVNSPVTLVDPFENEPRLINRVLLPGTMTGRQGRLEAVARIRAGVRRHRGFVVHA